MSLSNKPLAQDPLYLLSYPVNRIFINLMSTASGSAHFVNFLRYVLTTKLVVIHTCFPGTPLLPGSPSVPFSPFSPPSPCFQEYTIIALVKAKNVKLYYYNYTSTSEIIECISSYLSGFSPVILAFLLFLVVQGSLECHPHPKQYNYKQSERIRQCI